MRSRVNRRTAICGLLAGLAAMALVGCHHHTDSKLNRTMAPTVSYQTPTILATVGETYVSVVPDAYATVYTEDVPSYPTTGFTFGISPTLPDGLAFNTSTGVISGIPTAVSSTVSYTVTCSNSAGSGNCTVNLGVQATSRVSLAYTGAFPYVVDAVSASVGSNVGLGVPTVTGDTATGFGVIPALPAGLTVNPTSGLVSGTPTAALAATTYTLVATTPSGSADTSFTLLFTATDPVAPAGLAYGSAPFSFTVGQASTTGTPTVSAGASMVFTVSPALPAGLVLDPTTGEIHGTPTAATASADYTVTASNATGNSQVAVGIAVVP